MSVTRDSGADRPQESLFARIAGEDGIDPTEARNGLRHVASLSLTKVADGLIDPKLVLSWLLTALAVPSALVGMLVPIREAGALLPQVFLADRAQRMARRKWMWVAGSAVQGLAALAIAAAGRLLDGLAAGVAICAALAVLALARAACSVSYKDVLGKTIGETRRGAVTGLAGSVASAGVVIFALLLISGLMQEMTPVLIAIALAGVFWLGAAALFSTIEEAASEDRDGADVTAFREILGDGGLRWFILVRGLLVSTALAPPYLVLLAQQGGDALLGQLGALVLASAAASFLSSYVWGRLSDKSSRLVLALSGAAAALSLAAALVFAWVGLIGAVWAAPLALFGLMVAYHGVRQARSVWLVDYAPADSRAAYAAVANTAIGLILLAVGAAGGALSMLSPAVAVAGFAALALFGGMLALRLPEAEEG
ncbi:MFS transporter [Pseudooceanicola sp. LIPI14-2-Ac024]|uniref:MFS transporter n=1 Tax=Pseudooceanicola sp. LIPI14-2-Ac024 TaxID=3344875 RepID=UPI0035D1170B